MKTARKLNLKSFKTGDGFIKKYQELVKNVVVPYQYDILNDKVAGAEKSHVIQNFINAGKALRGEDTGDGFYGMVFQDSDLAKWIEAAAYTLILRPDRELEKEIDYTVSLVEAAQDEDGYLDSYFTIKDKDKRFKDLMEGHELYCAGHFMEAAVAYYKATGKKRLLSVMEKNGECLYNYFITEKRGGIPGHPEVELALLKLYDCTGNEHFLTLAEYFIDERGKNPDFFKDEEAKRDFKIFGMNSSDYYYAQVYKPVREQENAVGHAVRAVYLYTAMADLASRTNDEGLKSASEKLWKSITKKRMYVTGGIGSTNIGEAFSEDYDLPNDTAYSETCAAVGLIFFAANMLEGDINSEYSDVMERALYNAVLAGMGLDGKHFFYVNPLEALSGITGKAPTHKHVLPVRPSWHACACCPPNVARLISSIASYAYSSGEHTGYCHLFVSGEADFENGLKVKCETEYPYSFTVKYSVSGAGTLAVRIPNWSEEKYSVHKNGEALTPEIKKGYAYIPVNDGDGLIFKLDGSVKTVYPSPEIAENSACVCFQRGPLIYCAEGADNGYVRTLFVDGDSPVEIGKFEENLLGGTVKLTASGVRKTGNGLYSFKKPPETPVKITLIPYYAWANRGENEMRVWLPIK